MSTQIFINLPVEDIVRSRAFFRHLGFELDDQFGDEATACVVVSPEIRVMLLTRDRFQQFTPKAIADARESTEVLLCLARDSREAVDELVRRAVEAGGSTYDEAKDHGFMYGHGFQDPDGHIWELLAWTPQEEAAAGDVPAETGATG